jgi:hypothetical protein
MLAVSPLESELVTVADAFIQLQQYRHAADYDFSKPFTRADVLTRIELAEQAFKAWKIIRNTDNAKVFLASLLLQRHWQANT